MAPSEEECNAVSAVVVVLAALPAPARAGWVVYILQRLETKLGSGPAAGDEATQAFEDLLMRLSVDIASCLILHTW